MQVVGVGCWGCRGWWGVGRGGRGQGMGVMGSGEVLDGRVLLGEQRCHRYFSR